MKPGWVYRFARICIVIAMLSINILAPLQEASGQIDSGQESAQKLLEKLSPEEKVGQLFLVIFKGTDVSEGSPIYDLVTKYHIGGVTIQATNDNLTGGSETLTNLALLTREMQLNRWAVSQQTRSVTRPGEKASPNFIPLFIGITQEGGGPPNDQIFNGLTPLPNQMAIGATWDYNLAQSIGNTLGAELSALGINLLFGPVLDVLEIPRSESSFDLGTRSFGSDPYWVSLLGSQYIKGIHLGSQGRMAVIAKHFPGNGGSDRSPDEEVATVRKSLEDLENFDLVPFFAVTGNAQSSEETTDGLLASHIRYQGFQANIRVTTKPISFDAQAFNILMTLPAINKWREEGGVIVADNIGSQAVRRFYELTGQTYDARRVALNAFLAGNDILLLGDMRVNEEEDIYAPTINVIEFFSQKYREDPAFAEQVDQSVTRILTLKLKLYPNFNLNSILPPIDNIANIGRSSQLTYEAAQKAATLINPQPSEMNDTLPNPPTSNEKIVFITDVRTFQQCSQCIVENPISLNTFEQIVKRLYGPAAGGQIWPANLSSFSFEDLIKYINNDPNAPPIEQSLNSANWIIFSMLNVNEQLDYSQAVKRFLSEKTSLIQNKRLIVFAFDAPYYLDSTNISKLTAYFDLYSNNPIFVEVAARILFQEFLPSGALPVSVPGTGYDLITATSPDPDQVIELFIDNLQPTQTITSSLVTAEPTPVPEYQLGNSLALRTGIILDHNSNPVPDGTPVQFIASIAGETIFPLEGTTKFGVATTKITISNPGSWEIRVESEPAKNSNSLKLEIPANPDAEPSVTPTRFVTATPSPTVAPTEIVIDTINNNGEISESDKMLNWFITIVVSTMMGLIAYRLSSSTGQVRWGVRGGLLAICGGLLAYCYIIIGLPGSKTVLDQLSGWGILLVTMIGSALGIILAWSWRAVLIDYFHKT